MKTDKIIPSEIVDEFFHEYCEGRFDKEAMVNTILEYAKQYANERDEYREYDGDGVHFDIPLQCMNCTWVVYLTSEVAKCEITGKEHDWEYTCNKHRLRD